MPKKPRVGKCASVFYRGGAIGEQSFDDCSTGDPAKIILGCNQVPEGIDEVLQEMEIGEERTVEIPPSKAYGDHDSNGVQTYPRTFIANGEELHKGMYIPWKNPVSDQEIPVQVIYETKDSVTIDFNHPLVGKTLVYWLKLSDILG